MSSVDTSGFKDVYKSPTRQYSGLNLNITRIQFVPGVPGGPYKPGIPLSPVILGPYLDHLILELHPDHPSLEVLEQCICWIGNNLHW